MLPNPRCRLVLSALVLALAVTAYAQTPAPHPLFEVLTHRMDVDVDGAPNAYGPPGKPALDILLDAHYLNRADQPIVGYILDNMHRPVLQGPNDPLDRKSVV